MRIGGGRLVIEWERWRVGPYKGGERCWQVSHSLEDGKWSDGERFYDSLAGALRYVAECALREGADVGDLRVAIAEYERIRGSIDRLAEQMGDGGR